MKTTFPKAFRPQNNKLKCWPACHHCTSYMGVIVSVARLAHILWIGPVGAGNHVRTSCKNPKCYNPLHVYQVEGIQKKPPSFHKRANQRHADCVKKAMRLLRSGLYNAKEISHKTGLSYSDVERMRGAKCPRKKPVSLTSSTTG